MPLEERLELDIDEALRGIDQIEEALGGSATSFKVALAEALDILGSVSIGEVDASNVTTGLEAAVDAASLDPVIEADTSGITEAIEAATDAADSDVVVDAEVGSVSEAIEGAIAEADTTIDLEVDTSGAEAAIEDLGATAAGAGGGIAEMNLGVEQLSGLTEAATGSLAGLQGGLAATHPLAAGAAAGVAAVGASALALFHAALDSDTATRRFNSALGEMATRVEGINIEGFADDLGELAEKAGSDDEAMRLAAARIADLGNSAGASGPKIASTAEDILLLATRATVLNPTLGDAGEVADRMTNAFARGGRALAPFGIALSSAEINARALADTGKATADELSIFDKAAAGAAITTERLGTSLKTDIVEGAAGTEISLRSLREQFKNTLEDLGKPLLGPIIESIRAGQPLMVDLAEVLGELAATILPVFVKALEAGAPIVSALATATSGLLAVVRPMLEVLASIPTPVLTAVAAFTGMRLIFDNVAIGAFNFLGRLRDIPSAIGSINPATAALTLTVGLLAAAWAKHAQEQAASNARVREGAEAFQDEASSISDALAAITEKRIPENQIDDINRLGLSFRQVGELATEGTSGFERFLDEAERSGEVTNSVAEALRANGGDLRDLRTNYQQLGISQSDMNDSNLALIDTFQSLQEESQKSAQKTLENMVATDALTGAQERTAQAALNSKEKHVDYVGVLAEVRPQAEDAAEGTEGFTGSLEDQEAQAARTEAELQGLLDATIGFIDSQLGAERANLRFADALAKVTEAAAGGAAATRDGARSTSDAAGAADRLESANRRMASASAAAAQAQKEINDTIAAGQYDPASDSAGNLARANAAYADAARDAKAAQADLTEAQRDGTDKANAHAGATGLDAEQQRNFEDAVRAARDAAVDAAQAQVQLAIDQAAAAGGTIEASEKFAIYRQSLVEAAAQASGPTRDAILGVIATLDALPGNKDLNITANTSQAQREIAELNAELERLGIGASLNIALARAGGLMAGGSMQEGWTWVGEAGPELAYKQGGQVQVFSSGDSQQMASTPGGPSIGEINVFEAVSAEATAAAIAARWELAATP